MIAVFRPWLPSSFRPTVTNGIKNVVVRIISLRSRVILSLSLSSLVPLSLSRLVIFNGFIVIPRCVTPTCHDLFRRDSWWNQVSSTRFDFLSIQWSPFCYFRDGLMIDDSSTLFLWISGGVDRVTWISWKKLIVYEVWLCYLSCWRKIYYSFYPLFSSKFHVYVLLIFVKIFHKVSS